MKARPVPCESPALPHGLTYARLYVTGWRCDRHTPAALAGRPETPPGPGWPPGAYLYQPTPDPEEQSHDDPSGDGPADAA
ncbi:hypothetical protein [Streptomyces thermolilacinus]|uniref:hypothetical protein n=1 Tax=Streptomyces thermolilacinus TaxID=285540 RepID=UPI0033DD3470